MRPATNVKWGMCIAAGLFAVVAAGVGSLDSIPRGETPRIAAPVGPAIRPAEPRCATIRLEPACSGSAEKPAAVEPDANDGPGSVAVAASEDWREDLASCDLRRRARGVDELADLAASESGPALENIAWEDADPYVRERAVLGYGQAMGRAGVGSLRKLALTDPDENVTAAARAALHLIDTLDPHPPRGFVRVEAPSSFRSGDSIPVRIRVTSRVDTANARFLVEVPPGIRVLPSDDLRWRGSLRAGESREFTVHLSAVERPLRAVVTARLKLDPAEQLDLEVLRNRLRIEVDEAGEGRLAISADSGASER